MEAVSFHWKLSIGPTEMRPLMTHLDEAKHQKDEGDEAELGVMVSGGKPKIAWFDALSAYGVVDEILLAVVHPLAIVLERVVLVAGRTLADVRDFVTVKFVHVAGVEVRGAGLADFLRFPACSTVGGRTETYAAFTKTCKAV